MSKVISELLWFMITSLSDEFKVLAPLFQLIRSETKTNRGSRVHNFPRFVSATCNYFEFSTSFPGLFSASAEKSPGNEAVRVLIGLLDCLRPF